MTHTADNTDRQEHAMGEQYVRVVVVVDWVRSRVHMITSDQDAACQATRELAAKYDGNPNAVTMWAWAVDVPAPKPAPSSSVGGTTTSSEEQTHG